MAASQLIRIPLVRNPTYIANGTKSLAHVMQKYGIIPTKGSFERHGRTLMKRQDDGSSVPVIANDHFQDAYYTCPVQIGTPPQTLQLDFDSGSADFWVWSTLLPQRIQDQGRSKGVVVYDPAQSSTHQQVPDASFAITYGDHSFAAGKVATDRVQIGNIVIRNQHVELAKTLSSSLQTQEGSHGLLGLAFGDINTVEPVPVKTPLENMIAQEDIPLPLFTVYLGSFKDKLDPDRGESFYTFGGIDQAVVQASGQQLHFIPVDNSNGFWSFEAPYYSINGQVTPTPGNAAIADTGTTLMFVDDNVCASIYASIPGSRFESSAGGWIYPANTTAENLPTLEFAVGGKSFRIEKEHIGFTPSDGSGTMIFGGIQSRGRSPHDIWGATFLKCVYAVFDAGNLQFGVVQRADPTPDNVQFPPS